MPARRRGCSLAVVLHLGWECIRSPTAAAPLPESNLDQPQLPPAGWGGQVLAVVLVLSSLCTAARNCWGLPTAPKISATEE